MQKVATKYIGDGEHNKNVHPFIKPTYWEWESMQEGNNK